MQQKHRIFIAINLPSEIAKELAGFAKRWPELPARWTKVENLHITLAFLGPITDLQLGEICIAAKDIASRHGPFDLAISNITYDKSDAVPKYVWAGIEASKPLSILAHDVAELAPQTATRSFAAHITLARIGAMELRLMEPEEIPEIHETVDLPFTVESIEVMESHLKKGSPAYQAVESFRLDMPNGEQLSRW